MNSQNSLEPKNDASQYSLTKILVIWILASAPMALLGWIVGPLIEPLLPVDDLLKVGTARIIAITLGLIWLFVLSMIIVYLEEGDLKLETIKNRLWLKAPMDPKTKERTRKAWIWYLPFFVLLALLQVLAGVLDPLFHQIPGFGVYERYSLDTLLEDQEVLALLEGAWWFFFLFVIMAIFNTVLGEEFLFRGILLPKMEGKFGKYDWVANGVLMGAYHWHQHWTIPSAIISSVLVFSLASKRHRSTWMGVALHSVQSVLFIFLFLGVVLGLA